MDALEAFYAAKLAGYSCEIYDVGHKWVMYPRAEVQL